MTEYIWSSPGGAYVVPDGWRASFLTDFPGYRVRWSLKERCWHIEQRTHGETIPPFRIDPTDDLLIRAVDGYWRVMALQPGDRMACPTIVNTYPRTLCGNQLPVTVRKTKESICSVCRRAGRDGRTMAGYYPFDETLLDALRRTNPLTYGLVDNGRRTRASVEADNANRLIEAEAARQRRDAGTLDAVDYRWLTGIGASSALRRQIDHTTFR